MSDSNLQKGRVRWEGFSAASGFGSGSKILTVDDNDAMRYSLVRSLQDAGYSVTEARTGQEALALAANAPDLITLDVNLPDMTGFQVCRQLKSDPATSSIPVLHVSSTFVDPEYRVKGLEGGADAYLAEPIDRAELVATDRSTAPPEKRREPRPPAGGGSRSCASGTGAPECEPRRQNYRTNRGIEGRQRWPARIVDPGIEDARRRTSPVGSGTARQCRQLLAAITMNLDLIGRESDKLSSQSVQALADNGSMVREVMQSIRTISHLLHPPLLDEAGLPSALQWYVDEFSKRSGIRVDLDCEDSTDRLPSEMETAIFRIVQECLGNVHRHSDSQTASIRLEITGRPCFRRGARRGKGNSAEPAGGTQVQRPHGSRVARDPGTHCTVRGRIADRFRQLRNGCHGRNSVHTDNYGKRRGCVGLLQTEGKCVLIPMSSVA